ncbi:MAG: tRNA (guanosine(37)-N1)-methyltransferase TrmD [Enhygromyxa sp.]
MSEALEPSSRRPAAAFEVFTIFPAAIEAFIGTGIMGKAIERGLVELRCTDLREFTSDRHRTVDDAPFGGGAGMVIKPEPVAAALEAVIAERGPMHTILLTPSGARFDQRVAERLAGERRIALLCGRYEGIDDRIREHYVDECLSLGDFVLNGGEVAAAAIIEAVARLHEGVLGNPESIATESFADEASVPADDPEAWRPGLVLEHPHYTRPADFRGHRVPAVLLGGDHQAIESWRRRAACLRTWALRPELRPPWRLPASHPIILAAPSNLEPSELAELQEIASAFSATVVQLGKPRLGERHMRDLKQLRRWVRKRHGREPWVLGVGLAAANEPEQGPRLVLDTLAYAANQPPPPLVLDFSGDSRIDRIDAWLTLDLEGDRSERSRLAIPPALIDISQPHAAPSPITPLARAALEAMRAEGLLPAGSGRAPSTPQASPAGTDRETSP